MTFGDARLRIFVVENDPDTRLYLGLYLEHLGHSVRSASSIGEALATMPAEPFDVLVADIGLPDGTGWDLPRRMQEAGVPPPAYAIAVSGFGRTADVERSREAGFAHHLVKPFDPDKVEVILQDFYKGMQSGGAA